LIDLDNSYPSIATDLVDVSLETDVNAKQLTKKSTGSVTMRNKTVGLF